LRRGWVGLVGADGVRVCRRGRYQQCELMTAHYKQPVLLIEFDEKKSFNLEASLVLTEEPSALTRHQSLIIAFSFAELC